MVGGRSHFPEGLSTASAKQAASVSAEDVPLRPILARLRCDDTRILARAPAGRRVRVPGLTLMRQQPMTAKGVIFVTIEDEHGQANVVVYTHIAERDRVTLLTSGLMVVEGRVEREDQHAEVPIIHLIASRLAQPLIRSS